MQIPLYKGTITIDQKNKVECELKNNGPIDKPFELSFRHYYKKTDEQEFKRSYSQKDEGILYFNRQGKIIDRSPMSKHNPTKQLQEKYSIPLSISLASLVSGNKVRNLISGFFSGENGIDPEAKEYVRLTFKEEL